MAFFTSLLVYLGTIGGVVFILLGSLDAFLAGPGQPAASPQPLLTVSQAQKPATPLLRVKAEVSPPVTATGRWGPPVVLGGANDAVNTVAALPTKVANRQKKSVRRSARQTTRQARLERERRPEREQVAVNRGPDWQDSQDWAYQQRSDFEYRRFGHDDPGADRTLLR